MDKINTVLTSEVIENIQKRIKQHHELYNIKVSSTLWEETLYRACTSAKIDCQWDMESHRIGTDIVANDLKISCKTGNMLGVKVNRLEISSHRTSRFKKLEDKLEFLSKEHEDIIMSLVSKEKKYQIYVFKKPKLSDLEWTEIPSGWNATDEMGNKFNISKQMSGQLWMRLSMQNWDRWGTAIYDL